MTPCDRAIMACFTVEASAAPERPLVALGSTGSRITLWEPALGSTGSRITLWEPVIGACFTADASAACERASEALGGTGSRMTPCEPAIDACLAPDASAAVERPLEALGGTGSRMRTRDAAGGVLTTDAAERIPVGSMKDEAGTLTKFVRARAGLNARDAASPPRAK
jgi:hypothetical protein